MVCCPSVHPLGKVGLDDQPILLGLEVLPELLLIEDVLQVELGVDADLLGLRALDLLLLYFGQPDLSETSSRLGVLDGLQVLLGVLDQSCLPLFRPMLIFGHFMSCQDWLLEVGVAVVLNDE